MRRAGLGAALMAAAVATAAPALAQDMTAPRSAAGLFGGAGGDAALRRSLDATVSIGVAHEKNGETDDVPLSVFEQSGVHESIGAAVSFMTRTDRIQWGATGGTNLRYANNAGELLRVGDYGAVGAAAQLGRRWNVFANQAVTCAPLHFQGLLGGLGGPVPGGVSGAGVDYALAERRACTLETAGSLGLSLGARSTIELLASTGRTSFGGASEYDTLTSQSIGVQFYQNLTRRARLRVRYARRTGDYLFQGANATRVLHDVDIGIDYQRPLSLTRRTYVDFNVGSTAIAMPPTADGGQRLQYRVVGDAGLNHEFGRSWRARLGFSRGLDFIPGLSGPVFSNAVTGTLTGLLTRRIDLNTTVSVSRGELALEDGTGSDTAASNASTRVRFALSRSWAVFGEYTYYAYDFGTGTVAYAVPATLNRHAARAGLTWWIPLLRR